MKLWTIHLQKDKLQIKPKQISSQQLAGNPCRVWLQTIWQNINPNLRKRERLWRYCNFWFIYGPTYSAANEVTIPNRGLRYLTPLSYSNEAKEWTNHTSNNLYLVLIFPSYYLIVTGNMINTKTKHCLMSDLNLLKFNSILQIKTKELTLI